MSAIALIAAAQTRSLLDEVEAFANRECQGLWIPARVRGACHRAAPCADPLAHLAGTTDRVMTFSRLEKAVGGVF